MTNVLISHDDSAAISDLILTQGGLILDPKDAEIMNHCQQMSGHVRLGYIADKLVCCWGLVPTTFLSNQAYLWLFTTLEVKDHRFLFVRHSQRQIEIMLEHYEIITGHCKVDAAESIRWVKWLGGVFGDYQGDRVPFMIRKR